MVFIGFFILSGYEVLCWVIGGILCYRVLSYGGYEVFSISYEG